MTPIEKALRTVLQVLAGLVVLLGPVVAVMDLTAGETIAIGAILAGVAGLVALVQNALEASRDLPTRARVIRTVLQVLAGLAIVGTPIVDALGLATDDAMVLGALLAAAAGAASLLQNALEENGYIPALLRSSTPYTVPPPTVTHSSSMGSTSVGGQSVRLNTPRRGSRAR